MKDICSDRFQEKSGGERDNEVLCRTIFPNKKSGLSTGKKNKFFALTTYNLRIGKYVGGWENSFVPFITQLFL